jgi:hypothetical protein
VKLATLDAGSEEVKAATLKPNLSGLMASFNADDIYSKSSKKSRSGRQKEEDDESDDEDADGDEDSEIEDDLEADAGDGSDDDDDGPSNGSELYRAPKMMAVPYAESERDKDKRDEQIAKSRKKLKNTELLDSLREEFSVAPEAISSSGITDKSADEKKVAEKAKERRDFEEDRFVRLTMSRKDKKAMKKARDSSTKVDDLLDVGDIDDFEQLASLAKDEDGADARRYADLGGNSKGRGKGKSVEALQQAVSAFVESSGSKKHQKDGKSRPSFDSMEDPPEEVSEKRKSHKFTSDTPDDYDDDGQMPDEYNGERSMNRKRRKSASRMGGDDVGANGLSNPLEDFASAMKKQIKSKKARR